MPSGKVAILTGAASGIGEGVARDLVSKGWTVVCLDVQKAAGEALVAELNSAGTGKAHFIQCNITDYDQQARAYQEVWDKYGRLDALLANAGITDRSSVYILNHRGREEIPPKPDTTVIDVLYTAVVYGVQLAIHFMRMNPTPGGQIVITASLVGVHPHPCYPIYCGAKAATIHFAKTVEPILRLKENIAINCVLPGTVPTKISPQDMLDAFPADCLTPVSTVVAAYNHFLDNRNVSGEAIECSANKLLPHPRPAYANGRITQRSLTTWEPLFEAMHHGKSGLPDSLPEGY
ncbi:hypothetical protein MMC08_002754 [Hypocenomyce scalaris]|nr:hypothetical protein [Hypocenomyce scalaris]